MNKNFFKFTLIFLFLLSVVSVFTWRTEISYFSLNKLKFPAVALALNSNDSTLQTKLGNYYLGGEDYDIKKAESYFKRAIELNEKEQYAHYQLARIYFLKSNFLLGINEINKEIEYYPDFKKSYYVRGLIYGYNNDLDLSVENFKKFISLDSYNWAGYNDLSWVYFKKGDYLSAKMSALDGLLVAPSNPWLNNALGVAQLNLDEKSEAKRSFERALYQINSMTPEDWGRSYPGNDPSIYKEGFQSMKNSIQDNLKLVSGNIGDKGV